MRKEFKGTKGKWRVYGYDDTVVVSDIEHNGTVTEVHAPDNHCDHLAYCQDGTHWGEDIEVAQANARLIASAPDLLEALQRLLKSTYPNKTFDDGSDHDADVALRAINKALGE